MNYRKSTLRQQVLDRLRQVMIGTVRDERSHRLRSRLVQEYLRDEEVQQCVALYAPLAHELDLMPLFAEHSQHRYCFPRCYREGRMEFFEVTEPDQQLECSRASFLQAKETCTRVDPTEIDLILIPGIAFTKDGKRLGYGGGFYDRYLLRCPQALQVALCFFEQIVEDIPCDRHDLRIKHIIF